MDIYLPHLLSLQEAAFEAPPEAAEPAAVLPLSDRGELSMRPAEQVMQLDRLGSFHQFRLSFMRTLVRRMMAEKWSIENVAFDLDSGGYGTVVYRVQALYGRYSFVLFSNYLDDTLRNDRVIANQWDLTMALCEGSVDSEQLEQLRTNIPKQEAGRVDSRVLVLSRANKSARNFDYVVDELARGEQPNIDRIAEVGYLYRTTAAYGSGKLGMADWDKVRSVHRDFARPFAAEMFTCFMLRHFSLQQVEFLAAQRAPATAVALDDRIKRFFGIGNSTGLGMAPFLINHPKLINQWVEVRETALATVMRDGHCSAEKVEELRGFVCRVRQHLAEIVTEDALQKASNGLVHDELLQLLAWLDDFGPTLTDWQQLSEHASHYWRVETQELINSLLIELFPELVDVLENHMDTDERYDCIPEMPVCDLLASIERAYDWALEFDFSEPVQRGIFWYRSEEKMEPRLGHTDIDAGADRQMQLVVARSVSECYRALNAYLGEYPDDDVARFLMRQPQYRGIVCRIQTMAPLRYGEIRENLAHREILPMHLLRCKLSFFGVSKFDPRSRLWVRNTMFQGAPLVSDFLSSDAASLVDSWQFPVKPAF